MSSGRTSRAVRFAGGAGATLTGQLELPAEARAWALFVPCFTCLKDAKAVAFVSRTLAEHGIGVLRFDLTGLGESDGDFAATSFTTHLDDLAAAAVFLEAEAGAPRLLLGISLGGAVALCGAASMPSVAAVVTVNSPADTQHLSELLLQIEPRLGSEEAVEVSLLGQRTRIGRGMVEDLRRHDVEAAVRGLGRPLLIAHAPQDEVVSVDDARRLFAAARHPRSFLAIDGSDHLLLRDRTAAPWLGGVIAAWAERYL